MYDEVPNLPFLRPLDFENYKNSKFTGKASLALITNSSGQLLLNLRDDNPKIAHPNVWAFIGGVCEEGENDYDALVREVREEIELEIENALPLLRLIDTEGSFNLLTVYHVEMKKNIEDLHLTEGKAVKLFEPNLIYELPVIPFVLEIIDFIFDGGSKIDIVSGANLLIRLKNYRT
jgi:8-oxo-dGTP pyrophosphatase MutT (NUDIX family)